MVKLLKTGVVFLLIFAFLMCGVATVVARIAFADVVEDLNLSSKSAILVEAESGEILFTKDETKKLPIASMVKMMTILLALEEFDEGNVCLDSKIVASETASGMGGSQVFLEAFGEYSFEDLLKSVIVSSANDSSVALAEYFNGNEKAFVKRMNKRAKELGMNDTYYVNCTGLPAPEQHSTAKDCAILLSEILKHDVYHNYSTIWMDEIQHPSGRKTEMVNTNRLIRYFDGCDSGKTGSTNEAGCCLTASAKRGDMRLISVLIGAENSKTRFNETADLLNFGFKNFETKKLVDEEVSIAQVEILKGKNKFVDAYAKESFYVISKKGDNFGWETKVELDDKIDAPVFENQDIGKIVVLKNGNVVKEISVVAKNDVEHLSLVDMTKKILQNW